MSRDASKMISQNSNDTPKIASWRDGLKTLSEVTEHARAAKDWLAWIGSGLAFLGVGANSVGGAGGSLAGLQTYPWAIRIAVFVVISVALGWGLGALVARLKLHRNELFIIGAHLLTFCVAAFVIALAESLADRQNGAIVPQANLLALVGAGIVLMLLTRRLQAVPGQFELRTLRARSGIVFTFSASALALILLADARTV